MSNDELLKLMFAIYLENIANDLEQIQLDCMTDPPLGEKNISDLINKVIERLMVDSHKIRQGIQTQ